MTFSLQLNIVHEKPLIAKLLCLLFSVFIVFLLFASLHNLREIYTDSVSTQSSINIADNDSQRRLIKNGLDVELFGKYISNQFGDANIRPSILDLRVIGVMFSKDKKKSQVLLHLANGAERVFKIGDIIPGGAKILLISRDGIVVSRDGILERLNLPKDELIFDKPPGILNKNVVD